MKITVSKVFEPKRDRTSRVSLVHEDGAYQWSITENITPRLRTQLSDIKINPRNVRYFRNENNMYTFTQIIFSVLIFNNLNLVNPIKTVFEADERYVEFVYFLGENEPIDIPLFPDMQFKIKFLVIEDKPALKLQFNR